jgi:predicted nucleic acid-binding protein
MAKAGRFWKQPRLRESPAKRSATKEISKLTGVLYDTDVLVEILRGNRSVVNAALDLEAKGTPTYTSPISRAEVYADMQRGEEPIVQAFFETRGEVVLDATTGRLAGSYLARYARSHEMATADALMAARATTSGLLFWTQNRDKYPMPDIRFYDS